MNTSLSLLALACLIGEAPGCASSTHPRPEVLVARSGAPRDWHAGSDYSPDIGILATRSDDLEVALAGQSEGALERRNGDDSLQRVKRSQKGSSEQTKLEEMSIVTSSHKEASGREATSKPKKKEHPQNPHYNSKEVSEIVRKSKLKKQQEKDLKRYRTDPHSYDLVEGNEHRIVLLAGMIDWSPLKAPQTKAKSKKKLAKMRQPQTSQWKFSCPDLCPQSGACLSNLTIPQSILPSLPDQCHADESFCSNSPRPGLVPRCRGVHD